MQRAFCPGLVVFCFGLGLFVLCWFCFSFLLSLLIEKLETSCLVLQPHAGSLDVIKASIPRMLLCLTHVLRLTYSSFLLFCMQLKMKMRLVSKVQQEPSVL